MCLFLGILIFMLVELIVNHEPQIFLIDVFRTMSNIYDGVSLQYLINGFYSLTILGRRSLSYRNKSMDFQSKPVDWFLHDRHFRYERINHFRNRNFF